MNMVKLCIFISEFAIAIV